MYSFLQRLVECHNGVKKLLKIRQPLELSMGMSSDYEHAVSHPMPYFVLLSLFFVPLNYVYRLNLEVQA